MKPILSIVAIALLAATITTAKQTKDNPIKRAARDCIWDTCENYRQDMLMGAPQWEIDICIINCASRSARDECAF